VRLLLLVCVANGSPIIAKRLLGDRCSAPLDGGMRFVDGRPLLGETKTFRGVVAAIVVTALAATALGIAPSLGALFGAAAMGGDALASFIKRRIGVPPSGRAIALDQIPEALLPLLAVRSALGLSLAQVLAITAAFFVLELPLARLAYRLGVRDRPY
jgi:CDP-2,3-bis-(O-geranylgeranyl)-sn-glycerol synthase